MPCMKGLVDKYAHQSFHAGHEKLGLLSIMRHMHEQFFKPFCAKKFRIQYTPIVLSMHTTIVKLPESN